MTLLRSRIGPAARGRGLWFWLLAYLAGMTLCRAGGLSPRFGLYSLPLIIALLVIAALCGRGKLLAILALALGFGLGAGREGAETLALRRSEVLLQYAGHDKQRIIFRAAAIPERHEDYTVFKGVAERLKTEDGWIALDAPVRLAVGDTVADVYRGESFAALARLSRVHSLKNPDGFDYEAYLARRNIAVTAWVGSARELVPVRSSGWPSPLGWIDRLRERYIAWLGLAPGRGGELLRALLAGDREAMDQEAVDAFAATGLSHLLAISGLHLGLVSTCFFLAFTFLARRFPRLIESRSVSWTAAILTAPAVTAYALLTGMSVPTERALVMVLTYLAAVALDRRREVWNALALAAVVILLIWPEALFEASFQLSFVSVAGILYIWPRLRMILRHVSSLAEQELDMLEAALGRRRNLFLEKAREYLAACLLISVVAQWAVLPLMLQFFHAVNFLSPLYNLVAIPVCGLVLIPGGLLASLLAFFSPAAAGLVLRGLAAIAGLLVQGVVLAADKAPGLLLLPDFSWPGMAAWYGGGALLLEAAMAMRSGSWSWQYFSPDQVRARLSEQAPPPTRPRRGPVISAVVLGGLLATAAGFDILHPRDPFPQGASALAAIDVGQGQALLLRTAQGKYALVDGGGFVKSSFDLGKNVVAPCLLALGVTSLDAVVLTHPHPDHGKGLLYILRRFPVKEFWRGPAENGLTRELDTAARSRGIPIKVLDESAGEFDFGGAGIRVLHPPARARVDPDDLNNLSLVLRVADAGRTLLLTGDVEKETEELLVEKYGPEGSALPGALKADVMSVPHHGSRTSSTAEFLAATAPGWALASAGGHDRGGLPAPEVMQRYASRGVRVKTTDQDGFSAVVMTGDTTLVLTGPEMGEP